MSSTVQIATKLVKKDQIRIVVRAVILVGGHLLVAHVKGSSSTFLPGGHVEFGESLPAALVRELAEELGLCIHVSNYLGTVEHQWREGGQQRHQINHVFLALIPCAEVLPLLESREDHLEFFWIRPSDLPKHNLMPSPLIELVQQILGGDRTAFWHSTFATLN